ncbi:hypothetical protein [Sinomonas sp. R1AF57]|uniref:hypothetical protein n=1 Tax=Sinomonas sp. R1AF57 TaxID=2020377 RepID=UPI000B5F34D0|nr:hypothetical protein [Sinomonas sp. R1AF57]ASN51863.1 hypothetical protein CGQ25_07085 [Sinomonas sp. R1AF57]
MTDFEPSWESIAPLLAALHGQEAQFDNGALLIAPTTGAAGSILSMHDGDGAADATLLAIATGDIPQPPKLPEGGGIAEAPLGAYDAVELTVFGRPAAKGRIAYGTSVAAVGGFEFAVDDAEGSLGAAVVSALAEQAFLEGAEWLVTLVEGDPAEVPAFLGEGWAPAARLRRKLQ